METTTSTNVTTTLPVTCHSLPSHNHNLTSVISIEPSSPILPLDANEAVSQQLAKDTQLASTHSPCDTGRLSPNSTIPTDAHSPQSIGDDDQIGQLTSAPSPSTGTAISTQATRNKRKNFNPRCSAGEPININASDANSNNSINRNDDVILMDERNDADGGHCPIDDVDKDDVAASKWPVDSGSSCSSALSPSLAKDGDHRQLNSQKDNLLQQNATPDGTTVADLSGLGDIDSNKFFNIPNTNFSIAKTQAAFVAAAAAAAAAAAHAASTTTGSSTNQMMDHAANDSVGIMLQQHLANVARTNDALQQFQQTTQSLINQQQNTLQSNDPQSSPLQFACNAFNAVQELLNVYGFMSISPNDIVDAFKNQANPGE